MLAEAERKLPGSAVSICSKSFEKFWSKRLEGFLPSVENFKQQKSPRKKNVESDSFEIPILR